MSKAKSQATRGVCKLTGKYGEFVTSHLIPRALTTLSKVEHLKQVEAGKYPVRRWSSWYDDRLVTQAGEDILSFLDNWAITQLRKHKLVWSGWGPAQVLPDVQNLASIYPLIPPNATWVIA